MIQFALCLDDAAGRNTWIDVPASQSKDDYFIEVDLGSNPEIAECVQTEAAYPFLISYLWKEAPCPDALDCPAYATDCVDLTGNEDCLELPVSMPLAPWGGYVRPSAECSPWIKGKYTKEKENKALCDDDIHTKPKVL